MTSNCFDYCSVTARTAVFLNREAPGSFASISVCCPWTSSSISSSPTLWLQQHCPFARCFALITPECLVCFCWRRLPCCCSSWEFFGFRDLEEKWTWRPATPWMPWDPSSSARASHSHCSSLCSHSHPWPLAIDSLFATPRFASSCNSDCRASTAPSVCSAARAQSSRSVYCCLRSQAFACPPWVLPRPPSETVGLCLASNSTPMRFDLKEYSNRCPPLPISCS